jgi:hypothetical protein
VKSAWVITQASEARMERSEIRAASTRHGYPGLRSAPSGLRCRAGARARFMMAFSRRTQNKDSFAAPKILPLNDFLHFARCALLRDLTAGPRWGSAV